MTFEVGHAPPPQPPPTLQYAPVTLLEVVDTAVVAVALHAVMVVQDVDVIVVDERIVTTCVQDGTAEAEHDEDEEVEDPEEDDVAVEVVL